MNLVALKVKITRGLKDGKAQNIYPDFNELPPEVRGEMDWSYFVDMHGLGWHYDKKSGFGEADVENDDPTCQYGCLVVPVAFATAAETKWPSLITRMSEAEFEKFYEDRAHDHEDTEKLDTAVLQGIQARVALEEAGIAPAPSAEILERRKECLDPKHPRPGIRRNPNKGYKNFKARRGFNIV